MAPNLLVVGTTLFRPDRWFTHRKISKASRKTQHWHDPVPGIYEYIPGRGWFLTIPDSANGERLALPQHVKFSQVLKRHLLQPDYDDRKKHGQYLDTNGKVRHGWFFRLDDGITWVKCWDRHGEFVPGPYERWCIDKQSGKFRKMLKGDDPEWQSRRSSRAQSVAGGSSTVGASHSHLPSQPSTRPSSFRGAPVSKSVPNTRPNSRANSINEERTAQSQPNTRPGSVRHDSVMPRSRSKPATPSLTPSSSTRDLNASVAAKRILEGTSAKLGNG